MDCSDIGFPLCDESTCFETCFPSTTCSKSTTVCSSYCPFTDQKTCSLVFQCSDGSIILASQFCNGISDCPDNSDEIRNQPGFKCTQSADECVLPQSNLYDNVSHCSDDSDHCLNPGSCFRCFDQTLMISFHQVCDGVIDCYDMSDECLCFSNINTTQCNDIFAFNQTLSPTICPANALTNNINPYFYQNNPILIYSLRPSFNPAAFRSFLNDSIVNDDDNFINLAFCDTKLGRTTATLCDGRPECKDMSDECNVGCENPPSFCNSSCFLTYPIGDRYCDGIEDPAWRFINQSSCPKGFDESDCPYRFQCKASNKVSIDILQVCDGLTDCDDGTDEVGCPSSLFSSETELIASPVLRSAFWIIGLLVIIGNLIVITINTKLLKTSKLTNFLQTQHIIILNISCADFLMGVYLITIAILSAVYSGNYGEVDHEWRGSLGCSVVGSLAVISSEASCFLMVTLTAFRLKTVWNPISSLSMTTLLWKVCIVVCWICALIVGILPMLVQTSEYFLHGVSFRDIYNQSNTWNETEVTTFVCRFAALISQGVPDKGSNWKSAKAFIESNIENPSFREFGFYGETSVCLPRFYIARGENAWEYTLAIITINFLVFLFIAVSYILVYYKSNTNNKLLAKNRRQLTDKEAKMQRRIARIILTDFFCWIPICVMTYVSLNGETFPVLAYQITAVVLLPINSALNPFLYSGLLDQVIEKFKSISF